jgi:beta-glucosidase
MDRRWRRVVRQGAALLGLGCAILPLIAKAQPVLSSRAVPILTVHGLRFRDLNRNGRLDRYEDWRLSPEARAADLLARMTLAEKAGQMVLPIAFGDASGYDPALAGQFIHDRHVTHVSSMLTLAPQAMARAANELQAMAEREPLAIPVVLATDPRHGYHKTTGASVATGGFSQWPDPTGLGAIGDAALVRRFAAIVRKDYRATGFTLSLAPQADLATEPRWPRIDGTFGEDPVAVAPLVAAYIEGIQGGRAGLAPRGVAAVVKHWVGYGAQVDGLDSHNRYGRFSALRGAALPLHLKPFEAAFAVHPSAVMPSYSIFRDLVVDGKPAGPVGAAFSAPMIHDLLRGRYGYRGVVLSDWAVTADCTAACRDGMPAGQRPGFDGIAMPWGVEDLPRPARYARAITAGIDQFGGEGDPAPIVEAVRQGLIREAQVDAAVHRILEQSFQLGLFEHPFVSETAAIVTARDRAEGLAAQSRAMVVLKTPTAGKASFLERPVRAEPVEARAQRSPHDVRCRVRPSTGSGRTEVGVCQAPRRPRIYLHGVAPEAARQAGYTVVDSPEQADLALVRLDAPYEHLHPGYFFGSMQHEGRLSFPADDPGLALVRQLSGKVPLVVDVYLDRPAILTPLQGLADTLMVDFGASDRAVLNALSGRATPQGRLPFELPRSDAAVAAQAADRPADSADPLYPLHFASLALH